MVKYFKVLISCPAIDGRAGGRGLKRWGRRVFFAMIETYNQCYATLQYKTFVVFEGT